MNKQKDGWMDSLLITRTAQQESNDEVVRPSVVKKMENKRGPGFVAGFEVTRQTRRKGRKLLRHCQL